MCTCKEDRNSKANTSRLSRFIIMTENYQLQVKCSQQMALLVIHIIDKMMDKMTCCSLLQIL